MTSCPSDRGQYINNLLLCVPCPAGYVCPLGAHSLQLVALYSTANMVRSITNTRSIFSLAVSSSLYAPLRPSSNLTLCVNVPHFTATSALPLQSCLQQLLTQSWTFDRLAGVDAAAGTIMSFDDQLCLGVSGANWVVGTAVGAALCNRTALRQQWMPLPNGQIAVYRFCLCTRIFIHIV